MVVEKAAQSRHVRSDHEVVGVARRDIVTGGETDERIARRGCAFVALVGKDADSPVIAIPLQHLLTPVCRCVIADEQLEVAMILSEHALDRLLKEGPGVEHWHDRADANFFHDRSHSVCAYIAMCGIAGHLAAPGAAPM